MHWGLSEQCCIKKVTRLSAYIKKQSSLVCVYVCTLHACKDTSCTEMQQTSSIQHKATHQAHLPCALLMQVVKELRSQYACTVSSTADRLATAMRSYPHTSIKAALSQRQPAVDGMVQYATAGAPLSNATQQKDWVETLMKPILAACEEALQVMEILLCALYVCIDAD